MSKRAWYPGLCLFLLTATLLACGQTPATTPSAQRSPASAPTLVASPRLSPTPSASLADFGFGVEYGNLDGGLLGAPRRAPASTYAAFGATWVKFTDITWGQIVPRSGMNACGGYSWGKLDGWVQEWQAAGFEIQMVLRSRSDWATQPPIARYPLNNPGWLWPVS